MKKLFRAAAGLLVLAYVWRAQIIDFAALRTALRAPRPIVVGIALMALANFFLATRWFLLLRAQKLPLPFFRTHQVHWATNFLSLVLPGSVGADLAKLWYVVGDSPNRKSLAVLSLLADRVVGSSALLFSAAIALAVFHEDTDSFPQFAWLARLLWLAAISLAIFLAAIAWLSRKRTGGAAHLEMLWAVIERRLPLRLSLVQRLAELTRRVIESLLVYRSQPASVFLATGCSLTAIALSSVLAALESHWLGLPVPPSRFFYIVPLSSLAAYFFFLPLGIGVGQVVYFQLFAWLGVARPELGATLCTILQLCSLAINLLGGAAFFAGRTSASRATTENLRRAG